MVRKVCFITEDGMVGTCINYGDRGNCEDCDKHTEDNGEFYYMAWKKQKNLKPEDEGEN